MLLLNADDVRRALPMADAIAGMKRAYAALSAGRVQMPLRAQLSIPAQEAVSLFMPAYLQDGQGEGLAVKAVSVFPRNPGRGLPRIQSAVLVLDPETGRPVALLEGSTLTAIRTGAGAGAATDLLARPESTSVAILGAGVQARTQLEAICTVRPIKTVWVHAPTPANVAQFIREMAGRHPIPADLRPAASPGEAVSAADIICAATTSSTPVFADADLSPGVHINGVGSFTPAMREIPPETVQRSLVVVDSREACMEEAGELIQLIESGQISPAHIHAELGEIVSGQKPGRASDEQITFFKSVGVAVQDVVAAQLALVNARELGIGQRFNW